MCSLLCRTVRSQIAKNGNAEISERVRVDNSSGDGGCSAEMEKAIAYIREFYERLILRGYTIFFHRAGFQYDEQSIPSYISGSNEALAKACGTRSKTEVDFEHMDGCYCGIERILW